VRLLNLDSVLENLSEYYEAQLELKRKVSTALFYPILMFVFCILVVIVLVTFVVPNIRRDLCEAKRESSPLPTAELS
jgi:type II secretory pathway component PulF